jgi:hypothetical protein
VSRVVDMATLWEGAFGNLENPAHYYRVLIQMELVTGI